jgi:hypothetical protein
VAPIAWSSDGQAGDREPEWSVGLVGEALRVIPLRWLAHLVHRVVAKNRGGLPRSTPVCALPAVVALDHSSFSAMMPDSSAISASRARFWFCGRSSIPNLWNNTRRWVFTASRLKNSSAAICWLVEGVA